MPSGLDCPVESASATNWPLVDEGRDTGGIGSSFLRELTPLLSGSIAGLFCRITLARSAIVAMGEIRSRRYDGRS